ncbi:helix-turn-helix domain-containing protein, partial [Escherichia coli]|nr:helix-turn-helix domain-containing protein [Escherichia coli]
MRNTFPADWIIQCALETGVPLDWLVSGIGESVHKSTNEVFKLQKFCLTQGNLKEDGECVWDKNYISIKEDSLYIVVDEKRSYIC